MNVCNPVGLTGTKTATPSFTRTWNWHLVKQVRVSPGGAWEKAASWTGDAYSHAFDYRLLVTNDATDSGYLLSGDITVSNPNTDTAIAPLTATVSEPTTFGGVGSVCVLTPDGGLPSVQSVSVTVASKDSLVVHYSCALSGRPADATKNVATISPAQGSGRHRDQRPGLVHHADEHRARQRHGDRRQGDAGRDHRRRGVQPGGGRRAVDQPDLHLDLHRVDDGLLAGEPVGQHRHGHRRADVADQRHRHGRDLPEPGYVDGGEVDRRG